MDPSFQGEFFYIFLMGADLLLSVFSCAVSRDTAKDRKVCHSISAQTVVSMHAASDFAGCKEPFDYVVARRLRREMILEDVQGSGPEKAAIHQFLQKLGEQGIRPGEPGSCVDLRPVRIKGFVDVICTCMCFT